MDATLPLPASEDEDLVVLGVLGRGGFAEVRHAFRRNGGEALALKCLLTDDPEAARRLRKEGALLLGLAHPNVLPMYEIRTWAGRPALLMRFAPGGSLESLLAKRRPPLDRALELFDGILAGVEYVHGVGIIHRDLKPSNILLGHDIRGRMVPWVADFGIARVLTGESARTAYAVGTPPYMAPEQYTRPADLDARVDVHALGWILADLTGARPRVAGGAGVAVPPAIQRTIDACTAARREDRPPDCEAVRALLRGATPRRRLPIRPALAVLAAGALVLALTSRDPPRPVDCPWVQGFAPELATEVHRCTSDPEQGELVEAHLATCGAFKMALLRHGRHHSQGLVEAGLVDLYTLGDSRVSVLCGVDAVYVNRVPAIARHAGP